MTASPAAAHLNRAGPLSNAETVPETQTGKRQINK